jgi:hypothetical protein
MSGFIIETLRKEMADWKKIAKLQEDKKKKTMSLDIANGIKKCLNDFIVGYTLAQMYDFLKRQKESDYTDGYETAIDCIEDCLEEIVVENGFEQDLDSEVDLE